MLTKDDLLAIGELIKTEIKPLKQGQEHIRQEMVTKSGLEANNRVLGTIIKVELAETNKRIEAVAKDTKDLKNGQERLEKKLGTTEVDHEDRIARLEHEVFNDPRPVKP